jgi:post-segregation antitoxin (ccd killing protein)
MGNIKINLAAHNNSANFSFNADLLQQNKLLNINILQALEQHLTEMVRQAQRSQWLAENQSALTPRLVTRAIQRWFEVVLMA